MKFFNQAKISLFLLFASLLAGNYTVPAHGADLKLTAEYSYSNLTMRGFNDDYFYFYYQKESCDLEVKRGRLHPETDQFIKRNWRQGGAIGFSFPQSSVEHTDCPGIKVDQPVASVPTVDDSDLQLHHDPEWEELGYYALVNRSSSDITVRYDADIKTSTVEAGACVYLDVDRYITLSVGSEEICDSRCAADNCTACPEPGSYIVSQSGQNWSVTNVNKNQLDNLSCLPL